MTNAIASSSFHRYTKRKGAVVILIRQILPADAEAFLALRQQLDIETKFMLLEPGERDANAEETRQVIERMLASGNSVILVAEENGQLVGYCAAEGGKFQRNRATAYIVAGVLQARAGQGIGSQLFEELQDWAGEHGIHRLELTVMAHNERALRLYQKAGFEIEGRKKHSLRVDGQYVDELYMGKVLP